MVNKIRFEVPLPDSCKYFENATTKRFVRLVLRGGIVQRYEGWINRRAKRTSQGFMRASQASSVYFQQVKELEASGFKQVADPDRDFGPGFLEKSEAERKERYAAKAAKRGSKPVFFSY